MKETLCAFMGGPRQLDCSLIVQDGKPCVLNKYAASFGKIGYSFTIALKQAETKLILDLGNLFAKARLRNVQPLSGARIVH
jgi:hypothetical protein